MATARAVEHYSWREDLTAAEVAALEAVAERFRGRAILDLGVGGGRTVPGLLRYSRDYLGVDYTPTMVERASSRFPHVSFRHADARDLSFLGADSIALAFFSCCGLGMVDHQDRLRILREVHRVLEPGGVFAFSTHNRRSPDCEKLFRFPEFEFAWNPARLAVRHLRFATETVQRAVNRLRFARRDEHGPGYAIVNDACHEYRTMLYYVTLEAQLEQLEACGYTGHTQVWNEAGTLTDTSCTDSSLLVAALKA